MAFDDYKDDAVRDTGQTEIQVLTYVALRKLWLKTPTTAHVKEPHDIIKEVRLLTSLFHPNIIPLIKHEADQGSCNLSLWMPYIPYSLNELLQSSRFSPHPIISFRSITSPSPAPQGVQFTCLAKSIVFQIICGVSYLHCKNVQITHHDIKPSNILLTPSGRAQIIDFGITFHLHEGRTTKAKDLWPDCVDRMYFEVLTSPYHAAELLFIPWMYDALAVDAWSLGATIAEFFTSLSTDQ